MIMNMIMNMLMFFSGVIIGVVIVNGVIYGWKKEFCTKKKYKD